MDFQLRKSTHTHTHTHEWCTTDTLGLRYKSFVRKWAHRFSFCSMRAQYVCMYVCMYVFMYVCMDFFPPCLRLQWLCATHQDIHDSCLSHNIMRASAVSMCHTPGYTRFMSESQYSPRPRAFAHTRIYTIHVCVTMFTTTTCTRGSALESSRRVSPDFICSACMRMKLCVYVRARLFVLSSFEYTYVRAHTQCHARTCLSSFSTRLPSASLLTGFVTIQ